MDIKKLKANTRSTKDVTVRDATVGIAANCSDVLTFLQAITLKAL